MQVTIFQGFLQGKSWLLPHFKPLANCLKDDFLLELRDKLIISLEVEIN